MRLYFILAIPGSKTNKQTKKSMYCLCWLGNRKNSPVDYCDQFTFYINIKVYLEENQDFHSILWIILNVQRAQKYIYFHNTVSAISYFFLMNQNKSNFYFYHFYISLKSVYTFSLFRFPLSSLHQYTRIDLSLTYYIVVNSEIFGIENRVSSIYCSFTVDINITIKREISLTVYFNGFTLFQTCIKFAMHNLCALQDAYYKIWCI